MNRSLIFVFLLFFATCAYSQTSSGNMMVGGAIEFSSRSYQSADGYDGSDFTFAPGFGYFIRDNVAIGGELTLMRSTSRLAGYTSIDSQFGFGPFVRYYKFTSNDSFAFFGEALLSFSTSKYRQPSGADTSGNGIRFALSPGATYFFNEHWAMEMSVTLLSISSSDPNTESNDDKSTYFYFGLDSLYPALGVKYHF